MIFSIQETHYAVFREPNGAPSDASDGEPAKPSDVFVNVIRVDAQEFGNFFDSKEAGQVLWSGGRHGELLPEIKG